ncbi:MAG: helix-turn-helix domain-containing protein [Candidatus Thermoplasmatota archaeon]|nr:helix-turn-helix domain-containing protein [Candidatus Thermoplasmatota archaeon]
MLETFDVDERHITQIVRVRRRSSMPDDGELKENEAELLSRYNLSYFQVLRRDEERREFTALIKQKTNRTLEDILRELHLDVFPTFPIIIREDESIMSLCAKQDELGKVLKVLQRIELPFEVRSLGEYTPPVSEWGGSITERQREVLRLALELGYYEVPARTNLTDLAKVIGISKAAMSKNLRRAEGRVLSSLIHGR